MKKLFVTITFVVVSCVTAACSGRNDFSGTAKAVPPVVTSINQPDQEGPALFQEEDRQPMTLTEEEKQNRIPIKISIPTFEIEAPIEPVGLDNEGRVDTIPNALTVGWYKFGPSPGAQGNAILDGHRDWKGELGSLRSIERLKPGEAVIIAYKDGSQQTFNVETNNTYSLDEVPESVMELKGEARVTLITCSGKFVKEKGGYQSRVVVVIK